MFQRSNKKLDARRLDMRTKKAALIGDFLDDDEKEEVTGEPQLRLPKEDELTPEKSLPGAPKGMKGEVKEDYTPMTAEEIAAKRKEHEDALPAPPVPPTEEGEEGEEGEEKEEEETSQPAGFRDVMKNLLKEDSAEGKKEKAQQDKFGPPEKIQETVDTLKEFYGDQLMDVDIDMAQEVIARADFPDILKERATRIFDSRSRSDMVRSEQLALSSLKAIMPKEIKEAEEWLSDTSEGRAFQRKIFDKYRIGRVMQMLENTILTMSGQSVVDQPSRGESMSPDQRKENKRLDQLLEAVKDGTISREEFGDAKRRNLTLKQFLSQKKKESSIVNLNMRKMAQDIDHWKKLVTIYMQKFMEVLDRQDPAAEKDIPGMENFERSERLLQAWEMLLQDPLLPAEVKADQEILEELKKHLGELGYNIPEGNIPGASSTVTIPDEKEVGSVQPTSTVSQMSADESKFLNTYTSDEIWDIARNSVTEDTSEGQMARRLIEKGVVASKLNMKKKAEGDTTGPGGESWEYEYTSGPTPTKDEPQKRKHRFPFHNRPSGHTPGEGDQGNLHDVGPLGGESDMNYLANTIESMQKIADNDLFSVYSFEKDKKWLTYTMFKKAYSKFRSGDIVVQYGKTLADCRTYRRRFGSIKRAQKSLVDALSPILAAVVGEPTPDDSLHDLQKGAPPGGAYGPRTNPYDKQPEQGNRDGFDVKNTPRDKTKRKFIPHIDTPDDEGSGFIGGRSVGENKKIDKKSDYSSPVVETPEERAAVIEQPAVKPINKDPKRPLKPKKRYDLNEQNLSGNPNYQGEDSSGFDKARMLLSMKKLKLNMKTATTPTYEALQAGLTKGQISQQEFDQMVEYFQLTPPAQEPIIEPNTLPTGNPDEGFVPQQVSEWDPGDPGDPDDPDDPAAKKDRGRLFFGKRAEGNDADFIAVDKLPTNLDSALDATEQQRQTDETRGWKSFPYNLLDEYNRFRMQTTDLPKGITPETFETVNYHHPNDTISWADYKHDLDENALTLGDIQSDVMQRSRELSTDYREIVSNNVNEISKKVNKLLNAGKVEEAQQVVLKTITNFPPPTTTGTLEQERGSKAEIYYDKLLDRLQSPLTAEQLSRFMGAINNMAENMSEQDKRESYPMGTRGKVENYFKDWDKELIHQAVQNAKKQGKDAVYIPTSETMLNRTNFDRNLSEAELEEAKENRMTLFRRIYDKNISRYSPEQVTKKDGSTYWKINTNRLTEAAINKCHRRSILASDGDFL